MAKIVQKNPPWAGGEAPVGPAGVGHTSWPAQTRGGDQHYIDEIKKVEEKLRQQAGVHYAADPSVYTPTPVLAAKVLMDTLAKRILEWHLRIRDGNSDNLKITNEIQEMVDTARDIQRLFLL